jgi:hypothetical protein
MTIGCAEVQLLEEHTMTMGSTHSVDSKYICSTLKSVESPQRGARMIKSFHKTMKYDQLL